MKTRGTGTVLAAVAGIAALGFLGMWDLSMLGIVPASIIYSGLGAGLGALLKRGEQPDLGIIFEWHILLPLLGLAALSLLPVIYNRLRGGKTAR